MCVSAILVSKFILIIPREKEGKTESDRRDGTSACTKLPDRYAVNRFKEFRPQSREIAFAEGC